MISELEKRFKEIPRIQHRKTEGLRQGKYQTMRHKAYIQKE